MEDTAVLEHLCNTLKAQGDLFTSWATRTVATHPPLTHWTRLINVCKANSLATLHISRQILPNLNYKQNRLRETDVYGNQVRTPDTGEVLGSCGR